MEIGGALVRELGGLKLDNWNLSYENDPPGDAGRPRQPQDPGSFQDTMNKNPFLVAAFHAYLIACVISWHSQARASLPEDDDSDVPTYLEELDQKASDAILGRTIRQLIAEPNEVPANDRMEEFSFTFGIELQRGTQAR